MTTKSPEKMIVIPTEKHFSNWIKKYFERMAEQSHSIVDMTQLEYITQSPDCRILVLWNSNNIKDDWVSKFQDIKCRQDHFLFSEMNLNSDIVRIFFRLQERHNNKVHLMPSESSQEQKKVLERLGNALASPSNVETILDAWWEGDNFVVMSSRFETLKVPLEKLTCFPVKKAEITKNFEIDPDGDYIYWPDLDVHLGWEQFLQITNPQAKLKAQQKSLDFNKRYGEAIKKLRVKKGLNQSDIEGLDQRQIRRIEKGECRATYTAIEKLAKAHGVSTSEYMAQLADLL
jgi:hypothetical protein